MPPDPAPQLPPDQKIPEELVQQLDQTAAEFHESKQKLEAELDSFEPDRAQRLEKRRAELHKAEQHVEEAHNRIHDALKHVPPK